MLHPKSTVHTTHVAISAGPRTRGDGDRAGVSPKTTYSGRVVIGYTFQINDRRTYTKEVQHRTHQFTGTRPEHDASSRGACLRGTIAMCEIVGTGRRHRIGR